jgi:hypothetical protein
MRLDLTKEQDIFREACLRFLKPIREADGRSDLFQEFRERQRLLCLSPTTGNPL